MKNLYAKIQQQIEKKNEQYVFKAIKRHKLVRFEPRDWVWEHRWKKHFLNKEYQN